MSIYVHLFLYTYPTAPSTLSSAPPWAHILTSYILATYSYSVRLVYIAPFPILITLQALYYYTYIGLFAILVLAFVGYLYKEKGIRQAFLPPSFSFTFWLCTLTCCFFVAQLYLSLLIPVVPPTPDFLPLQAVQNCYQAPH